MKQSHKIILAFIIVGLMILFYNFGGNGVGVLEDEGGFLGNLKGLFSSLRWLTDFPLGEGYGYGDECESDDECSYPTGFCESGYCVMCVGGVDENGEGETGDEYCEGLEEGYDYCDLETNICSSFDELNYEELDCEIDEEDTCGDIDFECIGDDLRATINEEYGEFLTTIKGYCSNGLGENPGCVSGSATLNPEQETCDESVIEEALEEDKKDLVNLIEDLESKNLGNSEEDCQNKIILVRAKLIDAGEKIKSFKGSHFNLLSYSDGKYKINQKITLEKPSIRTESSPMGPGEIVVSKSELSFRIGIENNKLKVIDIFFDGEWVNINNLNIDKIVDNSFNEIVKDLVKNGGSIYDLETAVNLWNSRNRNNAEDTSKDMVLKDYKSLANDFYSIEKDFRESVEILKDIKNNCEGFYEEAVGGLMEVYSARGELGNEESLIESELDNFKGEAKVNLEERLAQLKLIKGDVVVATNLYDSAIKVVDELIEVVEEVVEGNKEVLEEIDSDCKDKSYENAVSDYSDSYQALEDLKDKKKSLVEAKEKLKEDYLALYYSCLYEAGNELYDMIEKKIGLDEWEGHRESEIIDTVKAYLLKSTKIVWQSSMSRFFYQDDFEGGQQELQNEQVALNFLNRLREEGKIKEFYENGVRTIESKKKMVYDSIDSFDRVVDEKKLRKDYIFGGGSSREFDDNLHLDAIFKAQSDNDRNKKIEMRYEFIKKKYGEDYAIQDKKSIEILRDSFNFLNDDMIFYLLVAEGDDEYAKSKIGNKDFYKIKNMNSQEITCKDGIRGFGGLEPLTMDILVEETNIVNVALLLVGGFAGRGVGSLTGTSQALSKFSALYPRTAMILREWCAIGGGMLGGEIINPYLPDELQGVNVDFALMGGISGFLSKISSGVVMSGVLIEDTITGERKLIIETGESSFGAKGSISGDKVVLERYSAKQMDAFAKQMVERAVKAEEALKEVLGCGAKKESFDLVKLAEELKKKGSLSISDEQLEFILKGDFFEGDYLSPKELIDIFGENAEFVNSVQKRIAAANIVLKNKKLLPPGSSLSPEQKRLITLIESLKDSKLKKKLFIESGLFDFGEGCSESIFKELTEYIVLEIPELRVSLNSLKSSQTKFDPSKFPKYDNNLARSDVDIFMEIEARTGNPIDLNYYKARRYFVEKGYILNGGKPISDMETLVKELSKLENRNLHFKWVIDKEGELYIGIETTGNMPELTHSILAYGDEILGGGEINFFGSLDDLSVIANPKTGHYVPELGSEISPLEFSKDALEVLESYFKSKLLNLFLLIVSGS